MPLSTIQPCMLSNSNILNMSQQNIIITMILKTTTMTTEGTETTLTAESTTHKRKRKLATVDFLSSDRYEDAEDVARSSRVVVEMQTQNVAHTCSEYYQTLTCMYHIYNNDKFLSRGSELFNQ